MRELTEKLTREKNDVEKAIFTVIEAFEEKTGLLVMGVRLARVDVTSMSEKQNLLLTEVTMDTLLDPHIEAPQEGGEG